MKYLSKTLLVSTLLFLLSGLAVAAEVAPLPAAAAPAVIAVTVPTSAAKVTKIGTIDLTYIGKESEPGKTVQARLIEKKDKLEAKIKAEKKRLDTTKESIEAKLATLTAKQREAKGKEFQKKVEAFQKLVRDSEESFVKEQEDETGKIILLIEKVVSDYGKANEFAAIVIKKDMLYADSSNEPLDLTSIILKAVNDAWKKSK
jgi:outer membrane protein